jgi:hypothetical protein
MMLVVVFLFVCRSRLFRVLHMPSVLLSMSATSLDEASYRLIPRPDAYSIDLMIVVPVVIVPFGRCCPTARDPLWGCATRGTPSHVTRPGG